MKPNSPAPLIVFDNAEIVTFYAGVFDVETEDGAVYAYQSLEGYPLSLNGAGPQAGGTISGWLPYLVPESVTEASLFVDQGIYYGSLVVEFTNSDLEIDVPSGE